MAIYYTIACRKHNSAYSRHGTIRVYIENNMVTGAAISFLETFKVLCFEKYVIGIFFILFFLNRIFHFLEPKKTVRHINGSHCRIHVYIIIIYSKMQYHTRAREIQILCIPYTYLCIIYTRKAHGNDVYTYDSIWTSVSTRLFLFFFQYFFFLSNMNYIRSSI